MYHYVRNLEHTPYAHLKVCLYDDFVRQLQLFKKNYTFIRMEDVLTAVLHNKPLPQNAMLLTFDDGLIDHYTNVFPLLHKMGIQGSFFVPGECVLEKRMLAINLIHIILNNTNASDDPESAKKLVERLFILIRKYKKEYNLDEPEVYYKNIAKPGRYDSKDVIFIKHLLQKGLPKEIRHKILRELFLYYSDKNEVALAREWYMTADHLRLMQREGMFISSHGYEHCWVDDLSPEEKDEQIRLSKQFLEHVGVSTKNWVFGYPHGSYDDALVQALKKYGCALAFTTKPEVADLRTPFTLHRMDTNDFPKSDK